jgi:uncharacterized protein YcbX
MAITPQTPVWGLGISIEQLILLLYPTFLIPTAIFWYLDIRRRRHSAVKPKGYKKIGVQDSSNISDEYEDHKYAQGVEAGTEASGEPRWKIKALFIYPIKSCAPIELTDSEVEGTGLAWDRKFAWAELLKPQTRLDASEEEKKPVWTFRTLRAPGYEKLALVKPEVWVPDISKAKTDGSSSKDREAVLIIKYPNIPSGFLAPLDRLAISFGLFPAERSFQVPLNPPADHKYPSEDVVIWKNTPRWLNYGIHVPDDFRHYLGVKNPLTLFRVDPGSYREVHRNAPRKESLGYQPSVGFADAYPVHLLSLASVRDVAAKVRGEIPNFSARRFRSNVLITGSGAYNEDNWKRIRIGGEEFHCACHTVRCKLPNVDPDSSERHPVEPDKTLKSFRCIDDGDPNNACLGLMLVPVKEKGVTLKVGQGLEVLQRGEHHYIKQ